MVESAAYCNKILQVPLYLTVPPPDIVIILSFGIVKKLMLAHIDPISSGHFNEIRGLFKGSSINDVTVCDGSTNLSNKKAWRWGRRVQNCPKLRDVIYERPICGKIKCKNSYRVAILYRRSLSRAMTLAPWWSRRRLCVATRGRDEQWKPEIIGLESIYHKARPFCRSV